MENFVTYNPLADKSPIGVVSKNKKVKFEIKTKCDDIEFAYFVLKKDENDNFEYFEMTKTDNGFFIEKSFEFAGHYWYSFQVKKGNDCFYINKTFDNYSYLSNNINELFFQSVIEKGYDNYEQMQGGLIYQIFVDRFCKEGDVVCREPLIYREDWGGKIQKNTTDPLVINLEVFGGNFEGVTSKINYLKNLGVTTIYLNPISMANSNHKYDTADYMRVDPMFGTEAQFEYLVKTAKENGIKVIIDGVYNHTGSDSIYFNKYNRFNTLGAYKSQNSKFYSWYNWDVWPDKYGSWWGIDTLPSIRHDSKDFQEYIAGDGGVIEKYLKQGVSGVRLDVVDEISDEFTKKINDKVSSFGADKIVVGEVWEDASTKCSYSKRRKYFVDYELTSVMNYPVKESIINYIRYKEPTELVSTMRMLLNNYPKAVMHNLMNFLGTHDTGRFYSILKEITEGNEAESLKLYKVALTILFTLPGVPSIFYGDEYGMENNDGSSRGCFDWDNYKTKAYDWFLKLSKIRKMNVLKSGNFNILLAKEGKFVFERFDENERIIVCSNLKDSKLEINLDGVFESFISKKKVEGQFKLLKNEIEILIEKKKK